MFVDAESSALRVLEPARGGGPHPGRGRGVRLGVDTTATATMPACSTRSASRALPGGALYVTDTYNDRLRVWRGEHLWTVPVDRLCKPGGVDVLPDGRLVVADTGNHRVVLACRAPGRGAGGGRRRRAARLQRPAGRTSRGGDARVEAGGVMDITLDIDLDGDALDAPGRSPVLVRASATDPGLLDGRTSWVLDALPARVAVGLGTGSGRVALELRVATCGRALADCAGPSRPTTSS